MLQGRAAENGKAYMSCTELMAHAWPNAEVIRREEQLAAASVFK